jgi:DNA-binding transcriptional ArsR family regulator
MSQLRPRLLVGCLLGLVVLVSLSAPVVALDSTDSVDPTATTHATDSRLIGDSTHEQGAAEATSRVVETGAVGRCDAADRSSIESPHAESVGPLGTGFALPTLGSVEDAVFRFEARTLPGGDSSFGPTGLVALAGYSRHGDRDLLDDPLRARIYETIRQSPGVYPAALVDQLDEPRSTLRYHLRRLEREGLVSEQTVDGKRRYVTAEATAAERALSVVDEESTAARIVDGLARDDGATVSDLATRLDCSPSTVSYHLDRLEDAAVVERERDGQAVRNRLRPEVQSAVAPLTAASQESFPAAAGASDD